MDEVEMISFDNSSIEFYPEIQWSETRHRLIKKDVEESEEQQHVFKTDYDNFQTIDWVKEKELSRLRTLYYSEGLKRGSLWKKIKIFFDIYGVVLLLLLLGLIGALTAYLVSSGVHYFSDFREGICVDNILFNRYECCWKTTYDGLKCNSWKKWSQLLHISNIGLTNFVNFIFYSVVSISLACFSGYIVKELAPYAAGGGISEIKMILSGFVMHEFLGFGTYLIKSLALILSASSGLMLGQEGPMVHITCCIANLLSRIFPRYKDNEVDKRQVLSAGSAAGVALAFNAPIAGVLFSLEETSFYFPISSMWKNFFVSLIGVSALAGLLPYSSQTIFQFKTSSADWIVYELPIFAFIGFFGGLYAAFFTKLTTKWNKIKKNSDFANFPICEIFIVTTITCVLSYPFTFAKSSNHHLISRLFSNCVYRNISSSHYCMRAVDHAKNVNPYEGNVSHFLVEEIKGVSLAFVIKAILLVFTFGLQVPCGIFVPSIVLGSLYGRFIGLTMEYIVLNHPTVYFFKNRCTIGTRCIYPSLYAVVGSASILGGITQMTVCVVVMMLEITGKLDYILPLILAVMIAKWVSNALLKFGIYEEVSFANNYPFLSNKEEISLPLSVKYAVNNIFKKPLISLPFEGGDLITIWNILKENPFSGYPVITNSDYLHGYVSYKDIFPIINEKISSLHNQSDCYVFFSSLQMSDASVNTNQTRVCLKHIVNESPVVVDSRASFNSVVYIFQKMGVAQILVVHQGKCNAIITRKDVINYIHFQ